LKIENFVFLSYILDEQTPTYGNRNKFERIKKSDISKGDIANDTAITTTVHIGTHIDMPYHFYEKGQTIENYDANFWIFKNPLIVEIKPKNIIIKDELIDILKNKNSKLSYDILIVKTGICHRRESNEFWQSNFGFHPDIYDYLIENFPNIKVLGFDSISVSSFRNRMLGRESHKRFLNPTKPILLLEDMDLREISEDRKIKEIIIAPLRISKCDGLPCTVFGILND
jgi:kynurenine formamidase